MTTARRWLWILFLAIIGASEFVLLLPLALVYSNNIWIPPWYSGWFTLILSGLLSLALLRLAMDPICIRTTQFRYFLKYPPLWLSVILALLFAAATEAIPLQLRPVRATLPWWSHGGWLWITALLLMGATRLPRRTTAQISGGVGNRVPEWARAEGPITSADEDRYHYADFATRISARLTSDADQSVALLGPFGSGKTSILNLVRASTQRSTPQLWYVPVNCWGFDNSAIAPAFILDRLVEALERFVDCQPLRGVPLAYRRMMKAEPSGRLAQFFEPLSVGNPLAALATLSPILRCLDARVVILLEDADRTGRDFDPQHIQRLLWELRDIDRLTFVLAADPKMPFDVAKLCDHIELIPRIDPVDTKNALLDLRRRCIERFSFIDPAPTFDDFLKARRVDLTLERIMAASFGGGIPGAISILLDTPRRLKLAARRVATAWEALHGEVYFNDLLVLCVLREGAPEAFNFIVQHMDSARKESKTDLDRVPKEVKKAWDEFIASYPRGEAVQEIVSTLGFAQLSRSASPSVHPQGIANMEPSDYLRRALSEGLDPLEVRDQTVLSDIVRFRDGQSTDMLDRLIESREETPYLQRWEYFSDLVPTAALLPIAATVIDARLAAIHSSEKDEALLAVWRRANKRLLKTAENAPWLAEQVAKTLPYSLAYSHDLYYFWASQKYGIVNDVGRAAVRQAVYQAAQAHFTTPSALRSAVSPFDNWDLRHLVQPVDHDESQSPHSEPRDWSWLAPIVLGALQDDASLSDHIAALITDTSTYIDHETATPAQRARYTLNEANVRGIFGGHIAELVAAFGTSDSRSQLVEEAMSQLSRLSDSGTT